MIDLTRDARSYICLSLNPDIQIVTRHCCWMPCYSIQSPPLPRTDPRRPWPKMQDAMQDDMKPPTTTTSNRPKCVPTIQSRLMLRFPNPFTLVLRHLRFIPKHCVSSESAKERSSKTWNQQKEEVMKKETKSHLPCGFRNQLIPLATTKQLARHTNTVPTNLATVAL